MCYAAGSIDTVTSPCPMCKVFPHARCPHARETCRNRSTHPRMDVLYIKNAEVERFNGCGYCKWARTTPPPSPEFLRYNNPGWPGCCRAPFPSEYRSIPAADWRAVSVVHNVPIPLEIKAVLDTFQSRGPPLPPFIASSAPNTLSRASNKAGNDRKNSGGSSPSSKPSNLSKAVTSPASTKPRSGGSPQALAAALSRTSSGSAISSSAPSSPEGSEGQKERRDTRNGVDTPKRRVDSLQSSPNRKDVELEKTSTPPSRSSSIRRHTVTSRPSVTPATTSVSLSKVVANSPTPLSLGSLQARRRSSLSRPEKREALPSTPVIAASPLRSSVPTNPPISLVIPDTVSRSGEDNLSSASSSSGSSDGMGSLSDNTVTSDGGFTDYLSDESEAELQRQAEAKAAVLAINMAEELEFKAARLQLAHVDLQPPRTWNPTNITNTPPSTRLNKEIMGTLPRVGRTRG